MNDYEKGIELDPSFPYSQIQLAVVQYQLKMTASAMRTFEDTIKKFPLSSDVHNYYGELLADQGNLNVAVDMFSKAMSLDPNNPLPYINKAMLMYQSFNNVEEAINLCKSALEGK
jgi:import receptor subunit TOM70